MDERSLRVLKGKAERDSGGTEPAGAQSSLPHVLPHPLLPLPPPAALRGRILATLRALDAELTGPEPVLEPLIPPVSLKHRILEKLAALEDSPASTPPDDEPIPEPLPVPFRRAAHRREPRGDSPGRSSHPFPEKERPQAPLRRRPRWALRVDRAISIIQALASGAALILLVLLCDSTVRLMKTQAQVDATLEATQKARERAALARRAAAAARQDLAELQAQIPQRQEAHRRKEAEGIVLASAHARLQRTHEDLTREFLETQHSHWREKLHEEHADKVVTMARRDEAEALRSVEELRRKRVAVRNHLTHIERNVSAMAMDLK